VERSVPGAAGIRHHDVGTAQLLGGRGQRVRHLRLGTVPGDRHRATAGPLDLPHHGGQRPLVNLSQTNRGAFGRQQARGRRADPPPSASDERYPSLQPPGQRVSR
jgi:hypothetical protein